MVNTDKEVAAILAAMTEHNSGLVEQLIELIVTPEAQKTAYYNYEGIMAFLMHKKILTADPTHDVLIKAYA